MHKLVFNIRSASPSDVRALSNHCRKRTRDRYSGYSEIDQARTHLNETLHGCDVSLNKSLQQWYRQTKCQKPFDQAEKPYITIVIGASHEFFDEHGEAGIRAFKERSMGWLRETFGDELVFAELHLDETTPHLHAMIAPTFEKKVRTPGRKKRNETDEEFEARKEQARQSTGARTVGRSFSKWAFRDSYDVLRMSASKALEPLGISYGEVRREGASARTTKDFVKAQKVALDHRAAELEIVRVDLENKERQLSELRDKLVSMRAEVVQKVDQYRGLQERERKAAELVNAAEAAIFDASRARAKVHDGVLTFELMIRKISGVLPSSVRDKIIELVNSLKEVLGLSKELSDEARKKLDDAPVVQILERPSAAPRR